MQPVLCSDLTNKLLISRPFDSKDEAQGYLKSIEEKVKKALPDVSLSVVSVAKNALPDFTSGIDYAMVESRGVLMKDDSL